MIEIDIPRRKIHLDVSDEEFAVRAKAFDWKPNYDQYPRFLRLFAKNVGPMSKGGIWE
jgi:dihydroxyacid dehydratase/phosphogluconate dehydratase